MITTASVTSWWARVQGYVLGALCAAALCLPIAYLVGRDHGREIGRAEQAEAERKARALTEQSRGAAALEREGDIATVARGQGKRDNAINATTDSDQKPSAASNALNCERMRSAGRDVSQLPACGGRAPAVQAGAQP